jgi:hypothetical protein
MVKTLAVDHVTVTQSDGHTVNGITARGVNYLQMGNVWRISPISPKDNQARSDQNLRNAKSYTCQPLPDSTIDGEAALNYRTRAETDDAVAEATISISKSTGLAIQVDNYVGEGKSHYVTHYSYTGVHAPSVQK